MNRSSLFAMFLLVVVLSLAAGPAQAQTDTSKPIVVKQPKPRTLKFKGEVISATRVQITVRSAENERMVRTFQVPDKLQEDMQVVLDRGGYQNGDKVEIHHMEGTDVVLKIKDKRPRRSR